MKHHLDITMIHRNKTITVPLDRRPDLQQRVRAAEAQYGVQIVACTYQPAAGHLLTMKYKKEEDSGAESPAVTREAA